MTQILVLLPSWDCEDPSHLGFHSVVPCEVSTCAHSDTQQPDCANEVKIHCRLLAQPGAGSTGVHGRPGERTRAVRGLHGRYLGLGTGGIACILLLFLSVQQPLAALGPLASVQCPGDGGTRWVELVGSHAFLQGATCKLEGSILTSPSSCTSPWVPSRGWVGWVAAPRTWQVVPWAGSS